MGTRIRNLETYREGPEEAVLRVHIVDLESKCYSFIGLLAWVDCDGGDLLYVSMPSVMVPPAKKCHLEGLSSV